MRRLWVQFRIWTAASVISGYISLALTPAFGPILLMIGLAATLGGFAIDRSTGNRDWYKRLWNILAIAYLVFAMFDLTLYSGHVIAMTHLLVFVQVAKCLNSKGRKDYIQIYLMSFFQLLASAALDTGLGFAFALLLFFVTTLHALTLFTMVYSAEIAGRAGTETPTETDAPQGTELRWKLAASTSVFATITVLVTLALFCVIPRVRMGILPRAGLDIQTTGFDQQVDLNTYGRIHNDSAVAMTVRFPEHPGGYIGDSFLLKGISLDVYSGSKWRQLRELSRRSYQTYLQADEFDKNGMLVAPNTPEKKLLRHEITIENMEQPLLFGLPNVRKVRGSFKSATWDYVDGSWRLMAHWKAPRQIKYTAFSDVDRPSPDELRSSSDSYDRLIRSVYVDNASQWLRVDDIPPRVVELARQVTKGADTSYDKAVAISKHIRQNYFYLMNVEQASEQTPLEDFLFRTKAGHCQYLATSMAVMLRATGVPTRVTTGYRGGLWIASEKAYLVRESDAHVWVEVFFPGYGWVEFDPSPVASDRSEQSLLDRIAIAATLYRYRVQLAWARYIVGYNRNTQRVLTRSIGMKTGQWRTVPATIAQWLADKEGRLHRGWHNLAYSYLLAWIFAGILAALLVIYYLRGRRELLRHASISPAAARRLSADQQRAMFIYSKMLRLLKYRHLVKPRSSTPAEFSRAIADRWPAGESLVTRLTDIYYTLRYARPTDSRALIIDADTILKQLHRCVQPNLMTRHISI